MIDIKNMNEEYEGYCKDESRSVGYADSISFPENEKEVIEILRKMNAEGKQITIQGGRTGLAGAAVPYGGHVLNLSKMSHLLGLSKNGDIYYLRVEPGLVLINLRKMIDDRAFDTTGWSEESLAAYKEFTSGPEYFFPTDPTETSACIGGIVSCNASGARTYHYGPARSHVRALRIALCDGDVIALKRGEVFAKGRSLSLTTEGGRIIDIALPTYKMPNTKNASGYYIADDMDAIDLFIGSDGTLGVITEIEIELLPLPKVIWGISCFFDEEATALDFTIAVRDEIKDAVAIEYFDRGAIGILRRQKTLSTAFAALPDVDEKADDCVFVELHCEDDESAMKALYKIGEIMTRVGGDEKDTWVARTAVDKDKQQFFRHACPESTNMLIDERKRIDPIITKLGADMSVPDARLKDVVEMYRRTLKENNLETAIWGHIGNNHLHVNILPRDGEDYKRGKELYKQWARTISDMGGAVSAEHGVGKMKRDFLTVMYGIDHIKEMARMKQQIDPEFMFGRGNLFAPDVLTKED
ncbi:MAG: FAD-binding oxidoreductase [Lachnospiraceae bacterium]|nr:FAD-binding oxidoreductase [Candidatus Minthocola equi]